MEKKQDLIFLFYNTRISTHIKLNGSISNGFINLNNINKISHQTVVNKKIT